MNKRIDFTNLGGFPVVQETFNWMQESYRKAFGALAQFIGDKVILHGCTVANGAVSNGWVVIAGELLPFVGSAYAPGDTVVVIESKMAALFNDGNSYDVYFEKYATIGSPGGFPFTDLKSLGTVKTLFQAGMIMLWSGAVNNIPFGWALCDGQNGTPNLSGKFIVGYDAADSDYNQIGNTGGTKGVSLTQDQLPPFQVPLRVGDNDRGGSSSQFSVDNVVTIGKGDPHENRPPYYTLAYIIKL